MSNDMGGLGGGLGGGVIDDLVVLLSESVGADSEAVMLNSYDEILALVLRRGGEPADGTSDFHSDTETGIIEKWRELWSRHPWLCLRKYPPGVILTAPKIDGLTLTVPAGSSAGTLSAASATPLRDYIVVPSRRDYFLRITAHTAGSAAITLDAVPEDLVAAEIVIAKHEYDLPADVGILHDTIKAGGGHHVLVIDEERLEQECGQMPTASWPPRYAARISKGKLRFSSYPSARERLEVPYNREPEDPSGSNVLAIDAHLRPVLANGGLSLLYEAKQDSRMATAEQRYEKGILLAQAYEHTLKTGTGTRANARPRPRYQ